MNPRGRNVARSGFALVITLLLLALLVLAIYALSALARVSGDITESSARQVRARQHALLGLSIALGEVQRLAGADDSVTAMAGVTGLAANASHSTRHWCGVWTDNGGFRGWLTSAAGAATTPALAPGIDAVTLVGAGSVGAAAGNSEHVIAGKIAIEVTGVPGAAGSVTSGHYAFWVGDEGVKLSASAPDAALRVTFPSTPTALVKLGAALEAGSTRLASVVTYEQLAVLPTPALAPSVLQDSFHHVTLTSRRWLSPSTWSEGVINVNTNSTVVWRSLCETYNAVSAGATIPSAKMGGGATATPQWLANNLPAASGPGKVAGGPFLSVAAMAGSGFLANALAGTGVTPAQFLAALEPLLTARSDTFRIRAYGDAVSGFDAGEREAAAYCEAIVQRTEETMPGTTGRRFRVVSFRWLLPSDI